MPIQPFISETPLRFRGISDSLATTHVEGSECCLIHADNPLSTTQGVFLNPQVQVGYNGSSYDAIHSPDALMSPLQIYTAIWHSRILRWFTTPLFKERMVWNRIQAWTKATGGEERGKFCLVNEMQIVTARGWRHA